MTEKEYINVVDLERLRLAQSSLDGVIYSANIDVAKKAVREEIIRLEQEVKRI